MTDVVTLIAAIIAAVASIWAAVKASSTAETLQSQEHAYQTQTRDVELCRQLQATFLDEIRGADQPMIAAGTGPTDSLKLIGGMTNVAQSCFERSTRASNTAAQLRTFCDEATADAADRAVKDLNLYGFAILHWVHDALNSDDSDESGRKMGAAATEYTNAVGAFEASVRRRT
jgi:hypothetical protein